MRDQEKSYPPHTHTQTHSSSNRKIFSGYIAEFYLVLKLENKILQVSHLNCLVFMMSEI